MRSTTRQYGAACGGTRQRHDRLLYRQEGRQRHGLPIARAGTTADMANGPVQRVEPFPDTIALLGFGRQEQPQVRLVLGDNAVVAKTGSK
jgi:hypothetical protein